MWKGFGKTALKVAVSATLLYLVARRIDFRALADALAGADLRIYALSVALFLLQQVVAVYSWKIALAVRHAEVTLWRLLDAHVVGSFVGLLLPSSVGMDAVRAYKIWQYQSVGAFSASSLFATRVIGFGCGILLAVVGGWIVARDLGSMDLFVVIVAFAVAFFGGVAVVLTGRFRRLLLRLLTSAKLQRLAEQVENFYAGLEDLRRREKALLGIAIVSVVFQVLGVVIVYVVSASLGLRVPLSHFFAYVPVIWIVTLIPVSVAGFGVREGSFVYLFGHAGVGPSAAVALSLLVFAHWVLLALIGGVLFALGEA